MRDGLVLMQHGWRITRPILSILSIPVEIAGTPVPRIPGTEAILRRHNSLVSTNENLLFGPGPARAFSLYKGSSPTGASRL
jgi:hypothetical protein